MNHSNTCRIFHFSIFFSMLWSCAFAEGGPSARVFPVKATQGVAVDLKHFYAISNTKITVHSKENGEQISAWAANRKVAAQAHFQHMNSGTVIDGKLYVAHSRFPLAPNDNSVEVFLLENGSIRHEATIRMPKDHGSLTWIDKKSDDSWWMCYAVYGKPQNRKTTLVKYRSDKGSFIVQQSWIFPAEVVDKWGVMSCSGGSWGADGKLYVTGHDNAEVVVLEMDSAAALRYVRSEPVAGIAGQAIAWDRSVEKPSLWGIVKNKHVSLTVFPR